VLCDAHVHFFSPYFFGALAWQKGVTPSDALKALGWDDPVSPEALADRWVAELDRHKVARAALIASVPGDAPSVATAVARHPSRFVGYALLDPTQADAVATARAALGEGVRTVCLFPAMHRYSLMDERVERIFELAASFPTGPAGPTHPVFVHCGVLSVGARKKLGLPSAFDVRAGNPLDLHALALKYPAVPIVIPHFGAGLLREALMLADVCPNVYLDTSSSNAWIKYTPGLTLELVFQAALDVVGPDRLLFGTDSSYFPRGWNRDVYLHQRTALGRIGASADVREKIFSGNFQRLFPQDAVEAPERPCGRREGV
jgi:hypothetical protein